MVNAYFISGLGADKRVFVKTKLPDNYNIIHLDWIPNRKNETLTDYSFRMADKIDKSKPYILIGLSFGGIVVTELTKHLRPERSIVISSITNKYQMPWYYRFIGFLRLQSIFPFAILKHTGAVNSWFFGIKLKEERDLLQQILNDTDAAFLKWCVNAVLRWDRKHTPQNIYHIHGTCDRVFPLRYLKPNALVNNGGHFMVLSLYEKVNALLSKALE